MSCTSPLTLSSQLLLIPSRKENRTRPGTRTRIILRPCRFGPRMSLDQERPSSSNPVKLLTNITKLLWGSSLPPGLLVSTVRTAWNSTWQLMMSQLAPSDSSGNYTRPASKFRLLQNNPTATPANKLHLYVGLPCPWAHRTLIVRALKGLEAAVPVSIASPGQDGSWEFKETPIPSPNRRSSREDNTDTLVPGRDGVNGCKNLKAVYGLTKGGYSGRASVPMVWDVDKNEVLCNESYDIIQFFNSSLNERALNPGLDLAPPELKTKIEEWNKIIYPNVNNGVYRCGFAQSQEAYDSAVNGLFSALERIDDHLGGSRYLCEDKLTLADVCLFTTLIRFDVVYNVLFKCTKRKLIEYPNLHAYMREIYQIPKVAETCNFAAIMDGYYRILFPLNPGGIRPAMPSACEHQLLSKPHNRESLVAVPLIARK